MNIPALQPSPSNPTTAMSSSRNPHNIALEPAAQAFVEATSEPPFLYELPPDEGRKAVDEVQASEIFKPDVHEEWITLDGWPPDVNGGIVKARIVRPPDATGTLPVILYVHGAGWVFGDAHTHDRLVRDLALGAHAAVVFPEYDRSPRCGTRRRSSRLTRSPSGLRREGPANLLDASRMAVAGDSVGGNMATVLTLLSKQRGDVSFIAQLLFYPVTNAAFDTGSYEQFAEGYFLARDGMKWFWDQYTTDESDRAQITASPLRATLDDLAGLPPALVITGEADVLRDEGEAYAAKLRVRPVCPPPRSGTAASSTTS